MLELGAFGIHIHVLILALLFRFWSFPVLCLPSMPAFQCIAEFLEWFSGSTVLSLIPGVLRRVAVCLSAVFSFFRSGLPLVRRVSPFPSIFSLRFASGFLIVFRRILILILPHTLNFAWNSIINISGR